jgi:hypothetical protein
MHRALPRIQGRPESGAKGARGAGAVSPGFLLAHGCILDSQEKTRDVRHQAHTQTPDRDNFDKAFWDAIFDSPESGDDAHVWDCRVTKVWCYAGQEGIEVRPLEAFKFDRDQFERYQAEVSENAA